MLQDSPSTSVSSSAGLSPTPTLTKTPASTPPSSLNSSPSCSFTPQMQIGRRGSLSEEINEAEANASSVAGQARKRLELLSRHRELREEGVEIVAEARRRYSDLQRAERCILAQLRAMDGTSEASKTGHDEGEGEEEAPEEEEQRLALFGGKLPSFEDVAHTSIAESKPSALGFSDEHRQSWQYTQPVTHDHNYLDDLTAADFDDEDILNDIYDTPETKKNIDAHTDRTPLSQQQIEPVDEEEEAEDINDRYKPDRGRLFAWSEDLRESRNDIFRMSSWRPLQEEACNAAMDGKHVIVRMATAGGKSLCYQLPALLGSGITVVVAPLIALLCDQLASLEDKCIAAAAIHSGEGVSAVRGLELEDVLVQDEYSELSDYRILLVTPERITQRSAFRDKLKLAAESGRLQRIVIDEVHLFEHADSYRPAYPALVELRRLLPSTPFTFLSATMSQTFMTRLKNEFDLDEKHTLCLVSHEKRSNLQYSVGHKANALSFFQLAQWIRIAHKNQSGIIYISTIKHAELVVEELASCGITSTVYHGRLTHTNKQRAAEEWLVGKAHVMVATNAFGLGIDKADVRFVCHATLPRSLEDYHQECGRAGRDGEPAECLLWYTPSDVSKMASRIIENGRHFERDLEKFRWMLQYAQTGGCRADVLESYLWKEDATHRRGTPALSSTSVLTTRGPPSCCDNCVDDDVEKKDVTLQAWQILALARHQRRTKGLNRFTIKQLSELVTGRLSHGSPLNQKIPEYDCIGGSPVQLSIKAAERLIVELIVAKYLKFDTRNGGLARGNYGAAYVQLTLPAPDCDLVRIDSFEQAKTLKGIVSVVFAPGERSIHHKPFDPSLEAEKRQGKRKARSSHHGPESNNHSYHPRDRHQLTRGDDSPSKRRTSSRLAARKDFDGIDG